MIFRSTKKEKRKVIFTKDIISNPNYKIGDFTYGNPIILDWNSSGVLEIGKFCSIADGVRIYLGGNHRVDWISTYPFNVLFDKFPKAININGHPSTKGPVVIGNDVWIGAGSVILSGVNIGDGSVIGANSLISKDIPPYSIAVGNPGKVVKKRFDEDSIKKLLRIQWWNWPISKINLEVQGLCDSNITSFLKKHYNNDNS